MELNKVELLAPAGDLERLKIAITYGADAVYIGGEIFGMRSAAKNFSKEDMAEGVAFAHERGKKVFVTVNIIPHNEDFLQLEDYLLELEDIGIDAVIIADPGVLSVIKKVIPEYGNTFKYTSKYNQLSKCKLLVRAWNKKSCSGKRIIF